MKTVYIIICSLFFSCGNKKISDIGLVEIPVDLSRNSITTSFDELSENIASIELELTDKSMINSNQPTHVLMRDNQVIVYNSDEIFLFGIDGKFICTIGAKGQGPQEYISISNIVIDKNNDILYVNGASNIICYDLDKKKYLRRTAFFRENNIIIYGMSFNNDELFIIGDKREYKEKGVYQNLMIFRLNDELQLIDSCTFRRVFLERNEFVTNGLYDNFFNEVNSKIYFYYHERFKKQLLDTLYRFENNQLIPDMKLNITKNYEEFRLNHVYRSSRYVFVCYNWHKKNSVYCYDLETGRMYNDLTFKLKKDIIENNDGDYLVNTMRPVINNPEFLYCLHTNINSDDLEEPNPTLYLIKLKK